MRRKFPIWTTTQDPRRDLPPRFFEGIWGDTHQTGLHGGALLLSVQALTEGVVAFGAAVELKINHGFWLSWSTYARREMRMRSPKTSSATSAGRMMLNPRCARSRSFPQQKKMAAGLKVEAWGDVAIASRMVASIQGAPTSAGQPCVAYSWSNSVARWGVPAGGADRVGCFFLRKNVSRQGARWISASVAMVGGQCRGGMRGTGWGTAGLHAGRYRARGSRCL